MKAAVIGPICKDETEIEGRVIEHMGGIVYYTGVALKNLGLDVTLFASYAKEDEDWVRSHLPHMDIKHIDAPGTLTIWHGYGDDPDHRECRTDWYPNEITEVGDLSGYDVIILAPLFTDNIKPELVMELSQYDAMMVYGNFGMFTAVEDKKFAWKDPQPLVSLMPLMDYVFLDAEEAQYVADRESVHAAGMFLLEKGAGCVAITNGSKGSFVFHKEVHEIPAFKPGRLEDPTGAGDTFVAGFVKATELYEDVAKIGAFAAMTATMSIEKVGAFQESAEDVFRRLKSVDG